MSRIAVVHLVRRHASGASQLERFLASYRAKRAGVGHDLIVALKGFRGDRLPPEYEKALAGVARRLYLPDRGFDLHAYFATASELDYDYFCFLNSYSRILCDDWLAKMHHWITQEAVGLVGATGSYQSIATGYLDHLREVRGLPLHKRLRIYVKRVLEQRHSIAFGRQLMHVFLNKIGVWRPARDFPVFPNYHLRTNAFMAARATLLRVSLRPMYLKLSAYKFESGNDSLTNQILRMGLRVLVVGRDGEGYEPDRWHLSNTFWQSREENLLVADNQTEFYLSADPVTRAERARYAWGQYARPA